MFSVLNFKMSNTSVAFQSFISSVHYADTAAFKSNMVNNGKQK